MFKTLTLKTAIGFGVVLAALGGTSHADMVYDDVMGDTVWLTTVVESSPSGDVSPLFGQPTASGDNFDFSPTGTFAAQSMDGGGSDITDGKLSFMVEAKDGFAIQTLEILESGIATLFALGDSDAFASVSGIVDIDINEIDGEPVNIELASMLMEFDPNDGEYLHSEVATSVSENYAWSGGVEVNIAASLGRTPSVLGVTKLTVTLDNILIASTSGSSSIAAIDKKDFDIIITTDGEPGNTIPEPSAALLLMLSSVAMAVQGRRNV